jgi:type IV pilus assembly protein PilV
MRPGAIHTQAGATLVEVLVSMIILAVGLLSLVVLHGRLHLLQMESYQRSQALVLLEDLASRMYLNRSDAVGYVTGVVPIGGTGDADNCPVVDPADPTVTRAQRDLSEWCRALEGAAETIDGSDVGAMVGGRACVERFGDNQFMLTVAWQGLAPISAPPATVTCGANLYNSPDGAPCANDECRRVMTTIVRLADLDIT